MKIWSWRRQIIENEERNKIKTQLRKKKDIFDNSNSQNYDNNEEQQGKGFEENSW